ncbi:hypothetical protein IYW40_18620 [Methylocystis sp. H4A]|uniref:hypothetical protein n=1 Tax=Methylocystis sp. H4A TaxID=2785788 RepID=UPI0018C21865|nr:hypothetical protein [Methylocystis sp. H4A]MBG0803479.1 hypothetical protein [Methylocystis sp. H4A]
MVKIMLSTRMFLLAMMVVSSGLAGCGLAVPQIKEFWDQDYPGDIATNTPPVSGTAQIEFEIKKRIYCDLRRAVQTANQYSVKEIDGNKTKSSSLIPSDWGAQVSLTLEVDESSTLNPGVSLNTPMHNATVNFAGEYLGQASPLTSAATSAATYSFLSVPQSYAFALGGKLSSTATRIDKFDPYYSVAELMTPIGPKSVCNDAFPENDPFVAIGVLPASSSPLIKSDLGITEWLVGAMFTNRHIPSVQQTPLPPPTPTSLRDERAKLLKQGYSPGEITQIMASNAPKRGGGGGKPDTVTLEIKFVIVTNGDVTPTWRLVRVSGNTAAPFFGIGRTRIHDLIVTIGPSGVATANTHLASQIGNAVSIGNRSVLAAP